MKQFLFLVNPAAGRRGGAHMRDEIIACLAGTVPRARYDIALTGPELFRDLRRTPPEYETIVIAGGDGTISHAIDCLGRHPAPPRIGIIPAGTGNDLARSLNLVPARRRRGMQGLLEILLEGKTARVDMLCLNAEQLFINYFGMGVDARIARDFNRMRDSALCGTMCAWGLGKALFVPPAMRHMRARVAGPLRLAYRGSRGESLQMTLPGAVCQVLVTNIKTYAGGIVMAPRCRMDDGLFEVTVVPGVRAWADMHLHRIRRKPFDPEARGLIRFQTREITIEARGTQPCQIDGEACDAGQSVRIACGAQVEVVVP